MNYGYVPDAARKHINKSFTIISADTELDDRRRDLVNDLVCLSVDLSARPENYANSELSMSSVWVDWIGYEQGTGQGTQNDPSSIG